MISHLRLLTLVGIALSAATALPALAADELPVGLQTEPSLALTAVRVILFIWGASLLLAARRVPRFATGTFFLLAGLGLAWWQLAPTSYLLTIVAGAVVLAAGLVLLAVAPRVAMALATCWPFVLAYFAHAALGATFGFSGPVAIGLAVAGAILGAVLPGFSAGVVGAALGSVMVALAWPGEVGFWPVFAVFLVGAAWQLVLPRVVRPPLVERSRRAPRERALGELATAVQAALLLFVALLALALVAPRPEPADPAHAARLAVLAREMAGRPGFVLSPAGGFYLFGRALPISLAGATGGAGGRIRAAVTGCSPAAAISRMRTVKDAQELDAMRRAAAITASALRAVAPLVRPGANERDLEAAVLAAFRQGGATGVAFKSVVGSGANAVLPHYQENDAELREGLVVVDVGCTVDGYASDITRTFPVSGEWSREQRQLLDIVLAAKAEAAAALKPGANVRDLSRTAHKTIEKAGFGPYFIHGLGHHVGIDVHDANADTLAEGMVVTIEPGIYIPAGADVDRAYWNLGIRVEDTYLVTKDGGVPLAELSEVLPAGPAS